MNRKEKNALLKQAYNHIGEGSEFEGDKKYEEAVQAYKEGHQLLIKAVGIDHFEAEECLNAVHRVLEVMKEQK